MNLKQSWYPIMLSAKLKKEKMAKVKLYGESFVLFRSDKRAPVCLEDRCPHRGTLLSEGKIINGNIECRFHGWQFSTDGECKKIPTLDCGRNFPKKANARHRLCVEKYGIIWIWPEEVVATEIGPSVFPDEQFNVDTLFEGKPHQYTLRCWDVPYSYDLAIQDILDPAHLPYVHRHSKHAAQPFDFTFNDEDTADICGLANFHKKRMEKVHEYYRFYAPCLVQYDRIDKKKNQNQRIQFFCVPLDKQTTRIFCYNYMARSILLDFINKNVLLNKLGSYISNMITRQDHKVLHGQFVNRMNGDSLINQPIASDQLVMRYHKWADRNQINNYWFNGYTS